MKRSLVVLAASSLLALAACGSSADTTGAGGSGASGSGTGATTGGASTGGSSTATGGSSSSAGGASTGGGGGKPTAAELLAAASGCNVVSNGNYKTDDEPQLPADIPICGLDGAVFWKADMDIDCDGKTSAVCNLQTDPSYLDQTSATDSNGDPLDAATLPFVVIPLKSTRFDYEAAGLDLGSVIAVIYQGKVEYGVFGDQGPSNIIGEASYAMAVKLGIDPDPSTGGADSGVTYIAFTGPTGIVGTIEDHVEAIAVGEARAAKLLVDN